MTDIVETIGLSGTLAKHGFEDPGGNFESFFADLVSSQPDHPCISQLQEAIREYFLRMEIPDRPTLYDRLLLSLQPRDLIATFNWDPFIVQALHRNRRLVRLPAVVALHGSVALGACPHAHSYGYRWVSCNVCHEAYVDVPLLYPIKSKNYADGGFIASQWEYLRRAMKGNALFTIFGFSAPATDVEAVQLLQEMVNASDLKRFNEFEIIDVKPRDELVEKWEPFFVNHHYSILDSFERSLLAKYPRRTPEWLWSTQMMLEPFKSPPLEIGGNLFELQESARILIEEEFESENDDA